LPVALEIALWDASLLKRDSYLAISQKTGDDDDGIMKNECRGYYAPVPFGRPALAWM